MTHKHRANKHLVKEHLKQRHWRIALVLTCSFLVLALYTSGDIKELCKKSTELLGAAVVYWRFFGCLE